MAAGSTRYLLMRAAVCSGQVVKYPSLIACRKIDRAGTPAHACRKAMHSPMVLAGGNGRHGNVLCGGEYWHVAEVGCP